ncbi:MAG: hypothetical protein C4534_02050 [Gaiellales bacterium]|nr:MAG: hypothetical protein C4534_02050 [Gaiellales bacterium]
MTDSIGDNTVDLRDIDEEERPQWIAAVEATGYDFDQVLENEPIMINANYFAEYARELAEDIGAISGDLQWPLDHIDWDAAAEQLKSDYTELEIEGSTYLFRTF